ncbi:MAG: hypothetical protein WKF30_11185 [Pyrinomonadaceae bacterium]
MQLRIFILITLTLAAASCVSCGLRRTPNLERIFAAARTREGKRPVIIIPGILGSQLVNAKTGEVVWPSVFRSSDDDLDLPTSSDLAANRDNLVAARILDVAKFARYSPEIYVYYDLLQAIERFGGYREGSWDDPPANGDRDTFYVFAYDWRRDNVESARALSRRVEELKRKLNRPDLRFNILAHSMGGLVARYAAMYGDADLPSDAAALQPTWAGARFINKVFLFGTPSEGSAEAFASLLEGYSVTDGVRRRVGLLNKLAVGDVVTAPAAFQLMPHAGTERFLDAHLRPLKVDLYDPATWRKYGWPTAERISERIDEAQEATGVAEKTDRSETYLAVVLGRAKLFHQALDAQPQGERPAPVRFFTFGGDCEETLVAPLLIEDGKRPGRWSTLFRPRKLRAIDGRRISRSEVTRAMFAAGDGSVTRSSLLGENLRASAEARSTTRRFRSITPSSPATHTATSPTTRSCKTTRSRCSLAKPWIDLFLRLSFVFGRLLVFGR